jgi:hypothetical protein
MMTDKYEMVKECLKNNKEINDEFREIGMIESVKAGDIEVFKELVSCDDKYSLLNRLQTTLNICLNLARGNEHLKSEFESIILEAGADPNGHCIL